VKSTTRDSRAVILAPIVSEKSYALIEDGKYSFRVHPDAHKTQIRQAIEELFSVRVVDVKVIKVPPKPKRRGIYRGTRPGYKKAIVKVAEGQTIPVFEGVV
jgi:large subunit ribosomal protein L23